MIHQNLTQIEYANLGTRIAAYAIDGCVLIPLVLFVEISIFGNTNIHDSPILRNLLSYLIWTLYYGVAESSKFQGTLGKKICRIKVIDEQGNRLSFKKASFRFLAQIISILPLGFGIWSIASDKKKQAWHDMIVGCYVVKVKDNQVQLPYKA